MRDVILTAGRDLADRGGDDVAGLGEPAVRLDLLEVPPRLLGQLLGQRLDEPRTSGRVEHPAQMRFLQ